MFCSAFDGVVHIVESVVCALALQSQNREFCPSLCCPSLCDLCVTWFLTRYCVYVVHQMLLCAVSGIYLIAGTKGDRLIATKQWVEAVRVCLYRPWGQLYTPKQSKRWCWSTRTHCVELRLAHIEGLASSGESLITYVRYSRTSRVSDPSHTRLALSSPAGAS